jgi:hypothetical protein
MVVQFFSENIGGDRFWQLVEDMLRQPHDNRDLIELYHACLAAGFEGRFRVMPDGKRRLHEIQGLVQAVLRLAREGRHGQPGPLRPEQEQRLLEAVAGQDRRRCACGPEALRNQPRGDRAGAGPDLGMVDAPAKTASPRSPLGGLPKVVDDQRVAGSERACGRQQQNAIGPALDLEC